MSSDAGSWWQRGVIYQIYPRSFLDTNGDGIGDLPGITQGLAYLEWLGVDALWISPFYPSPMADFGYDISDHTAIDPRFGTLVDLDTLLAEAHRRRLKVILDYVPNHTSDQHPWFVASRAARDGARRDWYIWRDAAPGGGPPNNWRSVFGGSAWTWDAGTEQYYYHAYLAKQPDLNWRQVPVQEAMFDVLRFWLERGVDGFRVDALRQLVEDDHRRDNPPNPDHHPSQGPYHALLPVYTTDRPETLQMLALMRRLVDRYPDRLLIGELYLPIERLVAYYGERGGGVHLPANFHLILVEWQARRGADRRLRGRVARGRVAELGARQSRQASRREPPRPGPGARGRHAAPHLARNSDYLLRRRDRDAGRADPAGARAGPLGEERAWTRPRPRSRTDADAMGRQPQCGLQRGNAVAAAGGRC